MTVHPFWLEDEACTLNAVKLGRGFGLANKEQLLNKTGIEVIQAMMNGIIPVAPISNEMRFFAVQAQPGIVIFQGELTPQFLNPMGTIHGGWMSTVLDSAMGSAVLSSLPANKSYTTQSISVIFKKMLTLEVDRVRVIATVKTDLEKIKTARSAIARAELIDSKGTIYAVAKTKCRIFRTA